MGSTKKVSLDIDGWRYDIDLSTMAQASTETGMQRKMSVHGGPVEDAD